MSFTNLSGGNLVDGLPPASTLFFVNYLFAHQNHCVGDVGGGAWVGALDPCVPGSLDLRIPGSLDLWIPGSLDP